MVRGIARRGILRSQRYSLLIAWAALSLLPVLANRAAADPPAAVLVVPAAPRFTVKLVVAPAQAPDKPDAKPAAKGATDDAAAKAGPGEVLGFRQAEVAAQMTELEERMFRLSEAIKQLEPENSSRLMLGLKFAREELILHQMRETQQLLDKLNLGEAAAEQKHLLSKLQRLHDMLLSSDLDLQMRLEQLRQLRDIIRRLDKVIDEEKREQRQSSDTAALERAVAASRAGRTSLEELIRRQTEHVAGGRKLAAAEAPADEQTQAIAELAKAQQATHDDSRKLSETAASAALKLEHLDQAVRDMAAVGESLSANKPSDAAPRQQSALESLEKQLAELDRDLPAKEQELSAEKFAAMQRDQAANRQLTDGVTDSVRRLGEIGAGALDSLQSSAGNMSGAEKDLGLRRPQPASSEQESAVESLQRAREMLASQAAKLLDQLRAEVKRRVLEDLNLMLEKQIAIRESTSVLGSRAPAGGRQVLASVIALAKSEGRIVTVADELLALVEETEFGIALPAALAMVRDAMETVQASLAAADASSAVVARERDIEADLKDLLTAMKQLPGSGGLPGNSDDGGRQRERELNRLIAELKMIRIVQTRVNRSTISADQERVAQLESLSADLRRQIENVTNQQDDVRDVTERLFFERGDEIQ